MTQPGGEAEIKAQVEAGLRTLSTWAAGLSYASIPARVHAQAVLILGDNIAATLSAADEPELRAYHEQLISSHGAPQASLRWPQHGSAPRWKHNRFQRMPCASLSPSRRAVAPTI